MTAPTLRDVERALDSVRPRDGAIVTTAEGRLLAEREPAPGGCAILIVLGGARPRPSPGVIGRLRAVEGRSGPVPPADKGSQP